MTIDIMVFKQFDCNSAVLFIGKSSKASSFAYINIGGVDVVWRMFIFSL